MSATEVEFEIRSPDRRAHTEEQARVVMGLLREYSGKLAVLTAELNQLVEKGPMTASKVAWLLDQSELLRKPLLTILSRASGLRESAQLDSLIRDELSLRMFETEVHLHHAARLTLTIRDLLSKTTTADQVAKLRVAAGLPVIQGGLLPTAKVNP